MPLKQLLMMFVPRCRPAPQKSRPARGGSEAKSTGRFFLLFVRNIKEQYPNLLQESCSYSFGGPGSPPKSLLSRASTGWRWSRAAPRRRRKAARRGAAVVGLARELRRSHRVVPQISTYLVRVCGLLAFNKHHAFVKIGSELGCHGVALRCLVDRHVPP